MMGFPSGSVVKNLPASTGDVGSLGGEDALQEEMATHSSILACEIHRQSSLGELSARPWPS